MGKNKNINQGSDRYKTAVQSLSSGNEGKKLPVNNLGGKEKLGDSEFFLVDINLLQEFTLKDNQDFSPWKKEEFDELVVSVEQYGIMNPIIIRPLDGAETGYEILAGEHRWKAAKVLNHNQVPCRVFRGSDQDAKSIFALTNLLNRELTLEDKINWGSQYYNLTKGKSEALIQSLKKQGLLKSMDIGEVSKRQLYRYHRASLLPKDLFQAVKEGRISLTVGEAFSFFDLEEQTLLEENALNITNAKTANMLLSLQKGEILGESFDEKGVNYVLQKAKEGAKESSFTYVVNHAKKILKEKISKEDYGNAPEILNDALDLYSKFGAEKDILAQALAEYKKNHP